MDTPKPDTLPETAEDSPTGEGLGSTSSLFVRLETLKMPVQGETFMAADYINGGSTLNYQHEEMGELSVTFLLSGDADFRDVRQRLESAGFTILEEPIQELRAPKTTYLRQI